MISKQSHIYIAGHRAMVNFATWRSLTQKGYFNCQVGQEVLAVNPRCFRLTEVDLFIGNPTKAKIKLGWNANMI